MCWILKLKFSHFWLQLWYMVEKNWAGQLDFCWNLFSMFWRCTPGLCLRIKSPFSLDAKLLDYCWDNLFSESMTLLYWYARSIMTIRICIFHTWNFFQSLKMTCIHISDKNMLNNQPDISFMVVEKLFYFHPMNFLHIHQLTCMSSNISFFIVSQKNRSRVWFFMMVTYFAMCLLIYLLQN